MLLPTGKTKDNLWGLVDKHRVSSSCCAVSSRV